jgi:hypothetical protein
MAARIGTGDIRVAISATYGRPAASGKVYAFVLSIIVVVDGLRFVRCRQVNVYTICVCVRRVADGLAPSHNSISDSEGSSPENAKFFNENMMKKLKISGIVTIFGGLAAVTIGDTQIKRRDYQDC